MINKTIDRNNTIKIKERLKKKKLVKGIKVFLKKSKTKTDNMVANNIKIPQKIKKQKLFEYRKKH